MGKDTRALRSAAAFTALWMLVINLPAPAQVPSSPPPATVSTLEDSVQVLAGEVKDLKATIQELRADVSQSRQETRELRVELHGALEKLSSTNSSASVAVKGASSVPGARAATREPPPSPVAAANAPTEARLDGLEEDQQLLQAKVDEQHQTKVESASKYRVKLGGIALFNLFGNSGTVDNQDVPNLALPQSVVGTSGSVGATVRQSEIGLEAYGPTVAGAQVSGNVNFDFMGGTRALLCREILGDTWTLPLHHVRSLISTLGAIG